MQLCLPVSPEAYNSLDGWSWRDGCWVARLIFSRMKPWSVISERGGGGRGRGGGGKQGGGVGSKRGCEATGLKWDFHLFIYLAELIAQGCLLACFLLYVLRPQCPLPPPLSVSASANMCVCACTFTPLLPVFFPCVHVLACYEWDCVYLDSVYERVWAFYHCYHCMCANAPSICMKWELELVSGDEWYLLG